MYIHYGHTDICISSRILFLLVADPSLLRTCTVISVDDGLLRTKTICTDSLFSATLYIAWLKLRVAATQNNCH